MSEQIKIAAIQLCSTLNIAENLNSIDKFVNQAAKKGAFYVLTPEMAPAYGANRQQLEQIAKPFANNPDIDSCAQIAKKYKIFLHIGSMAIRADENKFFNRSILFSPQGQIVDYYDKIHLFDANPPNDRPYRESNNFKAGKKAVIAKINSVNIGFSICYDLRFPSLFRALAQGTAKSDIMQKKTEQYYQNNNDDNGADIIAVPAAFTIPTGKAHWEILLRARAIETGSFIIAAAQAGLHENKRQTWGHSMIIDGWGRIIGQLANQDEGLLIHSINIGEVKKFRQQIPAIKNNIDFC